MAGTSVVGPMAATHSSGSRPQPAQVNTSVPRHPARFVMTGRGLPVARLGFTVGLLGLLLPASGVGIAADEPAALPLLGETPAWVDAQARTMALEAAERGQLYDAQNRAFVNPAPSEVLVRPGTAISTGLGLCTANFLFTNQAGDLLIGTAGHCSFLGDQVFALTAPMTLFPLGITVADSCEPIENCYPGSDWAVIRIHEEWLPYTDADAAFIGGPCGRMTQSPPTGAQNNLVKHVGHGLVVGTGGTPRAGILRWLTPSEFEARTVTWFGDSGSPLIGQPLPSVAGPGCDGGPALGIITHIPATSRSVFSCYIADNIRFSDCASYGTRVTVVPFALVDGDGLPVPPPAAA